MRKHFAPYRPVMVSLRSHIEPVAYIFLLKHSVQSLIVGSAYIIFSGSEDDAHFPEIGIIVVRDIIYRIIKINGIVIKTICKLPDVKSSPHREAITCQVWMTKGAVNRVIASETATRKRHSFITCFMLSPGNKFC